MFESHAAELLEEILGICMDEGDWEEGFRKLDFAQEMVMERFRLEVELAAL